MLSYLSRLLRHSSILLLFILLYNGSKASSASEFRHLYSYTPPSLYTPSSYSDNYNSGDTKAFIPYQKISSSGSRYKPERKFPKILEGSPELSCSALDFSSFPNTVLLFFHSLRSTPCTVASSDPIRGPPSLN